MNRRAKLNSRKIEFEPKLQPNEPEKNPEEKKEAPPVVGMKGINAPLTFATDKKFDINKNSFIINLPPQLLDGILVVYEDGSIGIRKDDKIYECDALYIGDGRVVEIEDRVRMIGDAEFIITCHLTHE